MSSTQYASVYNQPNAMNLIIIDQRGADYFLPCEKAKASLTAKLYQDSPAIITDTQYSSTRRVRAKSIPQD